MRNLIFLFLFTFLFINTYGQKEFSENVLETKALNLILNNFDSIPSSNFAFYKRTVNAKLYYKFYVNIESEWLKDKITTNYEKRYNIFKSDTAIKYDYNERNLQNFNLSKEKNSTINIYLNREGINWGKGDLRLAITNKIKIETGYYIFIFIHSECSIVVGDILIKFDLNGNPLRLIFSQGEE